MTPDLCIYHANCIDGFTAAWIIKRHFPHVELHPAQYGTPPPVEKMEGRHVLIVDFSYPAEVLRAIRGLIKSLIILDHHRSAEAELKEFAVRGGFDLTINPGEHDILAWFDMHMSGAVLAWAFCRPRDVVPELVAYVADRDLWQWRLEYSREINMGIGRCDQTMETWDYLDRSFDDPRALQELMDAGIAIMDQRAKDVDAVIDTSWRWMVIGGHRVPVANAPFFLASEVGQRLSEGHPFAATYYDRSDGQRVFSLRSQQGGGADVSSIARSYGGGGHRHAAGFSMEPGWEGDAAAAGPCDG